MSPSRTASCGTSVEKMCCWTVKSCWIRCRLRYLHRMTRQPPQPPLLQTDRPQTRRPQPPHLPPAQPRLPTELLTSAEIRASDRMAERMGIALADLMENAGAAVADAIMARFAPCRVRVLA